MKKISVRLGCMLLFLLGSSLAMAAEEKEAGEARTAEHHESDGPMARFGVEGGFNLSSLNGPVTNLYDTRLGFVGGAFINLPLGSTLALQPEFLYEQKGGQLNGKPYQLDYMEVPILLNISFGLPVVNPGLLAGLAFDANLANQGVTHVSSTDVGLVLGAQIFISKFLVSGRYEVGLTDVSSDQAIRNGTFTLLAGLSFN
jgi:hypothetical protein